MLKVTVEIVYELVQQRLPCSIPELILKPYVYAACSTHKDDTTMLSSFNRFQIQYPDFFPSYLKPGQMTKKITLKTGKEEIQPDYELYVELTIRLWLFDRDMLLRTLELFFQPSTDLQHFDVLHNFLDEFLLGHNHSQLTELRTENENTLSTPGTANSELEVQLSQYIRLNLPLNLMYGIQQLTYDMDLLHKLHDFRMEFITELNNKKSYITRANNSTIGNREKLDTAITSTTATDGNPTTDPAIINTKTTDDDEDEDEAALSHNRIVPKFISPTLLAFQISCNLSHRTLMSRILFLIYSTRQINVSLIGNHMFHSRSTSCSDANYIISYQNPHISLSNGNKTKTKEKSPFIPVPVSVSFPLERKVQFKNDAASGSDDDVSGSEFFELLRTLQCMSNELWVSADHSDNDPLFQICYTLGLTLITALEYRSPKRDMDLSLNDFFNRKLVGILFLNRSPSIDVTYGPNHSLVKKFLSELTDFAIIRQPFGSPTDINPSQSWRHHGFQAIVLFAVGMWCYSVFRMEILDSDPWLVDTENVLRGNLRAFPQSYNTPVVLLRLEGSNSELRRVRERETPIGLELRRNIHRMLADAIQCIDYDPKTRLPRSYKGLHMLSRIIASSSFARLPSMYLRNNIMQIHNIVTEYIRFSMSANMQVPLVKNEFSSPLNPDFTCIFDRTYFFYMTQDTSKPEAPAAGSLPDCIEDLLILQSQIVRALPLLACRYWSCKGAASEPYKPLYREDSIIDQQMEQYWDDENEMFHFDDGYAVGANFNKDVDTERLTPTGYIREVAQRLSTTILQAHRRNRQLNLILNSSSTTTTTLTATTVNTNRQNALTGLDDTMEMSSEIELEFVTHETGRKLHPWYRVQMKCARSFIAIYADFLAAIGSGPLCADGRTCGEALTDFIGGPSVQREQIIGTGIMGTLIGSMKNTSTNLSLLSGGIGSNRYKNNVHRPRSEAAHQLPHCLHFDGLLQTLASAATELDPKEQDRRQKQYEIDHDVWKSEEMIRQTDALVRMLGNNTDVRPQPQPPTVLKPCFKILLATIRIFQAICTDQEVRDSICEEQFPLPARAMPHAPTARSDVASGFLHNSYLALVGMSTTTTNNRGAVYGTSTNVTDVLYTVFHLLKLNVGIRTKSALLTLLTRIADGSTNYSLKIRDYVEATQILRTHNLVRPTRSHGGNNAYDNDDTNDDDSEHYSPHIDIRAELDNIESYDRNYDASLAFCDLLRVLIAHVPMHTIGRGHRSPGLAPHLQFLINSMLLPYLRRPIRAGHTCDRWKLAYGPLSVIYEILRNYEIVINPPVQAQQAVQTAVRLASSTVQRASAFSEDIQVCPPSSRYKITSIADKGRWFLYAVQWDTKNMQPMTFAQASERLRQALSLQEPPRIASLSEVNSLVGPFSTGGRFKAWTADGNLCLFDANTNNSNDKVIPLRGGRCNRIWFLKQGPYIDDRDTSTFQILVEQPLNLTIDLAHQAAGYVPGDPMYDFISELPPVMIPQDEKNEPLRAEPIRSAGFSIMQELLSDNPLLRILINILTQVNDEATNTNAGHGVASLEDLHERQNDTSFRTISYRSSKIETDILASERTGNSVFSRMQIFSRSSIPVVSANSYERERLSAVSERNAEEAIKHEIMASTRGIAPGSDSIVRWREKVLCLTLSIFDAALSRDDTVFRGISSLQIPGLYTVLPKLLRENDALPYIMRSIGYYPDPRIGLMASRVMYHIASIRLDVFGPGEIVAHLLDPQIESAVKELGRKEILKVIARCLTQSKYRIQDENWYDDLRRRLDDEYNARMEVKLAARHYGVDLFDTEESLDAIEQAEQQQQRQQEEGDPNDTEDKALQDILLHPGNPTDVLGNDRVLEALPSSTFITKTLTEQQYYHHHKYQRYVYNSKQIQRYTSVHRKAEIRFAGVRLPISRSDGVFGLRAIQGWAIPQDTDYQDGHDARRTIILEMMIHSMEKVHLSLPPVLSIGHYLLGVLPDTTVQSVPIVQPSTGLRTGGILRTIDKVRSKTNITHTVNTITLESFEIHYVTNCLQAICNHIRYLYYGIERIPLVTELLVSVMLAALRDQRVCTKLYPYLDNFFDSFGYDDGNGYTSKDVALYRFLATILSTIPKALAYQPDEELFEQVYAPFERENMKSLEINLRKIILQDMNTRSYISIMDQQQVAFQNTYALLMECVATEIHFFATAIPVMLRFLNATTRPLIDSSLTDNSFMYQALGAIQMDQISAGMMNYLISSAGSIYDALKGKRSMSSVITEYDNRLTIPFRLIPALGIIVPVGDKLLQCYDITVVENLLHEFRDRKRKYHQNYFSGNDGSSNTNSSTSVLNLTLANSSSNIGSSNLINLSMNTGDINKADKEFYQQITIAKEWMFTHNRHILTLKSTFAHAAAFAQLASVVLHHTLPDTGINNGSVTANRAKQKTRWLFPLYSKFMEPLSLHLAQYAPERAEEDHRVESLVLVPFAEYLLAGIHRMHVTCPSVRLSTEEMYNLVNRVCIALMGRAPLKEETYEIDPLAAARYRGLMYACLLQLTHYAFGGQILYKFGPDGIALQTAPPPLILTSERLHDIDRDACAAGWLRAIQEHAGILINIALTDANGASAKWKPLAYLLVSTLLSPPTSVGQVSLSGMPYLHTVSGTESAIGAALNPPEAIGAELSSLRQQLVLNLNNSDAIRSLITSLIALDTAEANKSDEELDSLATRILNRPHGYDVEVSYSVSRRQKLLRMVWNKDSGNAKQNGLSENNDPSVSSVDKHLDYSVIGLGYDFALQTLLAISLASEDGPRILVENGLLTAIGRLGWLTHTGKLLINLRAQSLGLQGSNIDNIIATELAERSSRIQIIIQLLFMILKGHPLDKSLAADTFTWLRRNYTILDLTLQATLAGRTNIACLKLMRGFIELLRRIASIPGTFDLVDNLSATMGNENDQYRTNTKKGSTVRIVSVTSNVTKSLLDAARVDEMVMRLFQRFALQPRAVKVTKKTPLGGSSSSSSSVASLPKSWIENIVPCTPEEVRWAQIAIPDKNPARIEHIVMTTFDLHALTAGEHLCWSLTDYCRIRTAETLPALLGVAYPTHVPNRSNIHTGSNTPIVPVIFFRPPDQVAADSLRVHASPPIRALMEAIDQAAQAYVQAKRQELDGVKLQNNLLYTNTSNAVLAATSNINNRNSNDLSSSSTSLTTAVPALYDPSSIIHLAVTSQRATKCIFEHLLVVWLAHVVADPSLRMQNKDDLQKYIDRSPIQIITQESRIAPLLFERLKDVIDMLGDEAAEGQVTTEGVRGMGVNALDVSQRVIYRAGPTSSLAQPGYGRSFGFL